MDGDPDSSVWRKSPHVVNLKPMTRGDDARDNVKLYEKWVYLFLLVGNVFMTVVFTLVSVFAFLNYQFRGGSL